MKVLAQTGKDDLATVYVADLGANRLIEFVESVQPPLPREQKWVLIVSTLCGCPVRCRFCDAGGSYQGKLSAAEILHQIDYLVTRRYPDRKIPVPKFKIQFARMGEPAFNPAVLEVLETLPQVYDAPGLLPSLSTIAPRGTDQFFERLLELKQRLYPQRFQLQFSLHTTDQKRRDYLLPVKKWDLTQIARYGEAFYQAGGAKISLNFIASGEPVDPEVIRRHFAPQRFLIKITPLNPTATALRHRLSSLIAPHSAPPPLVSQLRKLGYEVIVSIGEWEENRIGSNCGQHVMNYLKHTEKVTGGYEYQLQTAL